MNRRYMLIILGSSKGIDDDLNLIADSETGVSFVDGNSVFIGTFYSPHTTQEIETLLIHRPAFLLFDISDKDNYMVNLPSRYFKGLFPEIAEVVPDIDDIIDGMTKEDEIKEIELTSVDDIIDKLVKNNNNRECLTEKEKNTLDNY